MFHDFVASGHLIKLSPPVHDDDAFSDADLLLSDFRTPFFSPCTP